MFAESKCFILNVEHVEVIISTRTSHKTNHVDCVLLRLNITDMFIYIGHE